MGDDLQPGDKVEYIAEDVFDQLITTGDVGLVLELKDGWVVATWPRSGVHSVPVPNVRLIREG